MPKAKSSLSVRLQRYVSELKDIFTTDGKVLFCQPCGKAVKANQRSQVMQHLSGSKHTAATSRSISRQMLLGEEGPSSGSRSPEQREFYSDLCRALISADIPLFKVHNPVFRNFLVKYTNLDPPNESTLRKNYLPSVYEETLQNIRSVCDNEKIWVSIDETTDSTGRKVGNVVVGVLKNDEMVSQRSFLLACREMSATNQVTVARLFNESLQLLWPKGIKYDNVLLFITDAASYMKKAAEALSVSYPKIIHVTCVVHGLHRVCETVRSLFPNVDKMISNGKKVFVKAPKRIDLFRNKNPDLPLPPRPVVTRWGTWLSAVVYYADNFDGVKSVVDQLDKEDSSAIEVLQDLFKDSSLRNDVAYISANLSFLCNSIKKLEETTNLLTNTVQEIRSVENRINSLTGSKIKTLKEKFKSVFEKNIGFNTMSKIALVLEGHHVNIPNVSVSDIPRLKYARLTSCDVERSFSQYRSLFRENRQKFRTDNLEMTFVTYCNAKAFKKELTAE